MPLRFGVTVLPNRQWRELLALWREAEALGLDSLWVPDHLASRYRPDWPWLEAWTMLAAMARETAGIRIGTLVSPAGLRPAAVLAKAAVTVDHASDGRLEVGLGAGTRRSGLRQYVAEVDRLLREGGAPPPVQRPRPPLVVAAWRPGSIRVAAELADAWNTMGGRGLSADEGLAAVRRQSARLDEACAEIGRDPASIRRSLLLHERWIAAEPFASEHAFRELVAAYREAGIDELLFHYPVEEWSRSTRAEPGLFRRLATDVLPELRADAAA